MKRINKLLISSVLLSIGLYATTVPHVFTANTPAKASEVNANFETLADKLTSLEDNLSTSSSTITETFKTITDKLTAVEEGVIKNSTSCSMSPFPFTYNYVSSEIGEIIIVGGIEYIIVAVPFIEFGTGDHYYLKKPIKKSSSGVSIYFSTAYYLKGDTCFSDQFSGFPATYGNKLSYSRNYNITSYNNSFLITDSSYFFVSVKVNQTNMSITINNSKKLQTSVIEADDVDFRDKINWEELEIQNTLMDDIKTLINYVEIVKIP